MTIASTPIDSKALKRRVRIWTTVAVGIAVVIGIGLVLAFPRFQKGPPLPNPNGWDDFMAASQKIPEKSPDFDKASIGDVKAYVSSVQEALRLARQGLQKQTRVPTADFDADSMQRMDELSRFKRLNLAFYAEGKLAEMEGRPGDAAKVYLEAVQLGQQCGHGGMIIHYMVAIACENLGLRGLERVCGDLNAQQCRELAAGVEKLAASRESFQSVMDSEKRLNYSKGVIMGLLARATIDKAVEKTRVNLGNLYNRTQTLQLALAARAATLEKGKVPQY